MACSSAEDGSGGSGSSDSENGGQDPFAGSILFTGSSDGGAIVGADEFKACAGETVATESVPVDIFIMFDTSCSMSCPAEMTGEGLCCNDLDRPRINQVRDAVAQFLRLPESTGIGVGIGFFGYFPAGQTSCDPASYSQPAVPIAALPGNADALINSMQAQSPVGETPTGAAVRGACEYARSWRTGNPAHRVAILLVTDGYPEAPVSFQCNPTIEDAEQATRDCFASPENVPTYVLGVGGRLENLGRLAQAGGTGNAYLVDGASGDLTSGVLAALGSIRDAAVVPCDFTVPPAPEGQVIDPTQVNVTFRDAGGKVSVIPSVGVPSGCGAAGGWYYDNPDAPSFVTLCDTTCNEVSAKLIAASIRGADARIDLSYGCGTVVITR